MVRRQSRRVGYVDCIWDDHFKDATMTNEDKEDCLTVLKTMKETCAVFAKYRKADDPIIAAFIYGMNESADVLIEIIENKPIQIERMF